MNRFDTFSDETRRLFTDAQHEAERSQRRYITTEDLLLALIGIEDGVGAMTLVNLGVELAKVRTAVEFLVADRPIRDDAGLTPKAKRVVELAIEEARSLEHGHIGAEHVLLGLAREHETIAAGVLESMGATLARIRTEVVRLIPIGSPADGSSPRPPQVEPGPDQLTVRWKPEGTVDLGALIVTASAKGFAGRSAAYFNASEVLDFAARRVQTGTGVCVDTRRSADRHRLVARSFQPVHRVPADPTCRSQHRHPHGKAALGQDQAKALGTTTYLTTYEAPLGGPWRVQTGLAVRWSGADTRI